MLLEFFTYFDRQIAIRNKLQEVHGFTCWNNIANGPCMRASIGQHWLNVIGIDPSITESIEEQKFLALFVSSKLYDFVSSDPRAGMLLSSPLYDHFLLLKTSCYRNTTSKMPKPKKIILPNFETPTCMA